MSDLRNCPFCGNTCTVSIRVSGSYRDAIVICDGCEAQRSTDDAWVSPDEDERGLSDLVAAWNRRAPDPDHARLERELAEAREALRPFAEYNEATDPGDWADDSGEIGEQIVGAFRRSIKLGDLRRARRILQDTEKSE
ncbi:Lar family restriction alleviation protein [Mesorhizobium sp.]|uniref:Lar family restriction alleviation protein n=1 Tax=Mesorhizobium sp. TaxID=1871066 RepID=UPI00121A1459|nr:Lar family restriction alleviation protein [Mesorhizobium sp.]TIX28893.1 MAG: hypothetical protein E5V35_00600 [Mesorhizobium sp.]